MAISQRYLVGLGISWAIGAAWSYSNGFLSLYLIVTGFIAIFTNLSSTRTGESAYSVFNEG
jgi:hypothetical protein